MVTMTTPVAVCIERDSRREGKERVGEAVIRKQRKDLGETYTRDEVPAKLTRPFMERTELLRNGGFVPRLPGCPWVLVDADGTLSSMADLRTGERLRGPFEEHKVLLDDVYPVVADWVRALHPHYNVCVVSGRHDFCGDDTCEWLEGHGIPYDRILMRYSGDSRSDTVVKKEILDELCAVVGKENIAFVLDDRPKVVRMWRENGIKVYPVRGGTDHSPSCSEDHSGTKGWGVCACGALEDF